MTTENDRTARTLTGKVALVTGASRGVGRAIAERLAREGADVAVTYRSKQAEADETVGAIEQAGGRGIALKLDTTVASDVRSVFDEVTDRFGRLDIVVANAGVELIDTPITEITDEAFETVTRTNVDGTFYSLREAARTIGDGGRVIVIGSTTAIVPNAGFTAYAGSKAASRLYVETLAQELGPRGITVNSVVPGPLEDAGVLVEAPDEAKADMAALSPFGRMGRTSDVAGVVAFMAGPDTGWISGQHVVANGAAKI